MSMKGLNKSTASKEAAWGEGLTDGLPCASAGSRVYGWFEKPRGPGGAYHTISGSVLGP